MSDGLIPTSPADHLPAVTSSKEPKAALKGAVQTGVLMTVGAFLNYGLFASGALLFKNPVTLAVAALVAPVFLAIPAARIAARYTRKMAKRSPREAAAAAAGAGAGATAVVLGAFTVVPANLLELSLLAPVVLGSVAAIGIVGAQAFTEVPGEETPNLYLSLLASGLNGAHLAFWTALGGGIFTTLFPGFISSLLSSTPSAALNLFPVFAFSAVTMGMLAPVSMATGKVVGKARQKVPLGWLAAGLGLPLLVPIIVTLALAHALQSFHLGRMYLIWSTLGAGLIAGLAPHSLAVYLGLKLGRKEAKQIEEKKEAPQLEDATA